MNHRLGLASAKPQMNKSPSKLKHQTSQDSNFTLPPILKPLLNDKPKKKKAKGQGKGTQSQLKNAETNFRETLERFPEARPMMNMKLKDAYKDPHDQLDPHKPSRLVGADIPAS